MDNSTRIFKTRNFKKWAKKERIKDITLIKAIDQIINGRIDVNLGGGLLKQRIARDGHGKRGGHRTLIAFKVLDKAFFVFGFSKNDRENIDDDEKQIYKSIAKHFLALTDTQIKQMIKHKELYEVENG